MGKERLKSYKQFGQNIGYPMVMFEADTGNVLYMNYEAEVILGKDIQQLGMESGRTMVKQDFWDTLHNKKCIMWHRIQLIADGREFAASGFVNEVMENDVCIYTVLFDTQMKFGSIALESVLSQAGIVSLLVDVTQEMYRVEYVSKNINIYGYTREQLYEGKVAISELICNQDFERVALEMKQVVEKHGEDVIIECRLYTESNELVPIRIQGHCVYNEYGNFCAMELLLFDLRKELQRAKENDFLNHAIDKMKSVVLVKKYKPGIRELLYISSNAGMVGMNVEALKKGYKLTEDYIHPADREQVIEMIYHAIASGVTDYTHTYRMVGDDGKQRWVLNELTVTHSEEEEAQVSFLLTDITDKKAMEQALALAKEGSDSGEWMRESNTIPVVEAQQMDAEILRDLQEITQALNWNADYYNVVMDLQGRLLTNPVGPMKNMGRFYDIFERPEFKKQFQDISERAKQQLVPITFTYCMEALEIHMICAPVIVQNLVVAYWLLADFEKNEITILGDIVARQWKLANVVAKSLYVDDLVEKEKNRYAITHGQLEKEQKGRRLLMELMELVASKGEDSFDEVCQKTALFMNVTDIGIYIQNKESKNAEKYYVWNCMNENRSRFDKLAMSGIEFKQFAEQMDCQKVFVIEDSLKNTLVKDFTLNADAVQTTMVTLVLEKGQVRGYVVFVKEGRASAFDECDQNFAKVITDLIAGLMMEKYTNQSKVIEKESFLESYEYIREAVFIKDNTSGNIVYANKAMKKLFMDDVVGMPASDFVHDEMEHYKFIGGIRNHFHTNKKTRKWQSYMKELDQIMNIVEINLNVEGSDYCLVILKKSKAKKS